jgi:capsular polysaccharide biosynthesis protein
MANLAQANLETTVLYPERVLRRKLPLNLRHAELELFNSDLEQVIPQSKLLVMHDVWASSEGLLFKVGRILPESFAAPFLLDNWKTRSRLKFLAHNYLIKKRRTLEQAAAWIVDDWSGGYYHWFVDTLPRLFSIWERMKDLVLLLPHQYEGLEFVHASLKPFALHSVEFIGKNEVYFCRKLIVPMHTAPSGAHDEEIVRRLRDLLVNSYGVRSGERSERIYISRARARKRRIVNEEQVSGVLQEFGFRIVLAEELSCAEQVQACSSARYLVSNHGAGLTNMLFLPAGSNVLELRNKNDREYNCYFNLASALALNYFYQTCETNRPEEGAHTADLIVDTQRLRENIQLMLNSQQNSDQPVFVSRP